MRPEAKMQRRALYLAAALAAAADFRMTHIPYTGAGPAVTALLGGQVDAIASGPATVVQHIKAGKLRALAH